MKPLNGSIASLYEQVEKHVRPWIRILDQVPEENSLPTQGHISLIKLKRSLEKLLLEQN